MFYVTMTDKFLSGWGYARNKISKLVISCNDMSEAQIVYDNAMRRHEMKNVNIRSTKPYYNSNQYHVSYHGRNEGDYETWFSEQYDWE